MCRRAGNGRVITERFEWGRENHINYSRKAFKLDPAQWIYFVINNNHTNYLAYFAHNVAQYLLLRSNGCVNSILHSHVIVLNIRTCAAYSF